MCFSTTGTPARGWISVRCSRLALSSFLENTRLSGMDL